MMNLDPQTTADFWDACVTADDAFPDDDCVDCKVWSDVTRRL